MTRSRIFIAICMGITALALGLVAGLLSGLPVWLTVLVALLIAAVGWLAAQVLRLRGEVGTMQRHSSAFATLENALSDRLDAAQGEIDALSGEIERLKERLAESAQKVEPAEAPKQPLAMPEPVAADLPLTVPDHSTGTASKPADLTEPQVKSALRRDALTVHLQPVVALPSRQPAHFCLSMRMQQDDGTWVDDAEFMRLARAGGILPKVDLKMLHAAVRIQRTLGSLKKRTSLFTPLSEATLANGRGFEPLLRFARTNTSLAPSLIFAVRQADMNRLSAAARGRLGELVDAGFRLALTEMADLSGSGEKRAKLGITHAFVPADLLLGAKADAALDIGEPTDLAAALARHDITLIASDVDSEDTLAKLFDYDITSAIGTVFAPPRPVQPELVETDG